MARTSTHVVRNDAGEPIQPTSAENVAEFTLRWADQSSDKPKAGNDKYFGNEGFVSAAIVRKLKPNTIGKMLASLYLAAAENNSEDMQTVLNAVDEFRKNVQQTVKALKRKDAERKIAALAADADIEVKIGDETSENNGDAAYDPSEADLQTV